MSKQDIIELQIDTMANGGRALGRYQGKVIFVSGAIPGETVRARVTQVRKRWSQAHVVRVLDASPHRIEPPCPYYGRCGGCHLQHIAYNAQPDYKRQVVVEQLRRIGHIERPPVEPVIAMNEPWFYRNHAQFSISESGHLGFQAARSHDVIAVDRCLLLHPLLDELHKALDIDWPELERLSLRAGIRTGQRMCILKTKTGQAPELTVDFPLSCVLQDHDGQDRVLIGKGTYDEVLREKTFRVSAASFFQVNTEQTEVMLDVIEQYLDPQPEDALLDVYCGIGTLSLPFADRVARIIGIEENQTAIQDALVNAGDSDHVTLIPGKAERILPQLDEKISKAILDPPRQGCKPQVLTEIMRFAPSRIVYVSCDPTTLARDAAQFTAQGYTLTQAQPVDMFPQTYHIEIVTLWQK